MERKEESVWIPIEVDEYEDSIAFADRLIRWQKDPSSEPELEMWYRYGEPNGLPFEVLKPSQDEIDFEKYYPMYLEAAELEKQGKALQALEVYQNILILFSPAGSSYYERPIYLLETDGNYSDAVKICIRAIGEIENKRFKADINEFLLLKERLENKLGRYGPNVFKARINALLNAIKSNPGINKKNLHSILIDNESWSYDEVASVINYALEKELINRSKTEKAYSHFVNQPTLDT